MDKLRRGGRLGKERARLVALLAAAAAAAGVAADPARPAASPALAKAAAACASDGRTGYDGVLAAIGRNDYPAFEAAARALAARAAACSARLTRLRAAGQAACGRTVAIRGLRFYRDGGNAMAGAAAAGVKAGNSTAVGLQEMLRGMALARIAASEVAVGIEVLRGTRGCAKGAALSRPLKPATLRALPTLARTVATKLLQAQGGVYPEDKVAFGLLVVHLDTGVPPPAGAAEGQVINLQNQNPQIESWRLAGLRTFWAGHATGVDWSRYAFTTQRFLQAYDTYLTWKATARQQAINQFLGSIVGTEEAWRNAIGQWRAWEQRWYTREQASIAEYDAWERSFKAEKILVDAEALLRRGS